MPRFNLDNYETVEERHARALRDYPDLRCVLVNHTTPQDRAASTWVVEARVYLNADDQANELPKATEWAFEVDGTGGANTTSALENANTSALGRAIRWALGGSKGPSQTEMEKANSGVTPVGRDWVVEASNLSDLDALRLLWKEAQQAGASAGELEKVRSYAERLENPAGVGAGDSAGVSGSRRKKQS